MKSHDQQTMILRAMMALSTLAWAFVCLVVVTAATSVAEENAGLHPLCMSDDELSAFLNGGAMFLLGSAGGICCARDASPKLACRKVFQEGQRIEKTAEPYLRLNRDKALAPFRRSFGAQAETMFKAYTDRMEARLTETAKKLDQEQCASWLAAIEGFSLSDQKTLGDIVTSRLTTPSEFAVERQRIPRC